MVQEGIIVKLKLAPFIYLILVLWVNLIKIVANDSG